MSERTPKKLGPARKRQNRRILEKKIKDFGKKNADQSTVPSLESILNSNVRRFKKTYLLTQKPRQILSSKTAKISGWAGASLVGAAARHQEYTTFQTSETDYYPMVLAILTMYLIVSAKVELGSVEADGADDEEQQAKGLISTATNIMKILQKVGGPAAYYLASEWAYQEGMQSWSHAESNAVVTIAGIIAVLSLSYGPELLAQFSSRVKDIWNEDEPSSSDDID